MKLAPIPKYCFDYTLKIIPVLIPQLCFFSFCPEFKKSDFEKSKKKIDSNSLNQKLLIPNY